MALKDAGTLVIWAARAPPTDWAWASVSSSLLLSLLQAVRPNAKAAATRAAACNLRIVGHSWSG